MGKNLKNNPFAGKHLATNNTKAPRMPKTGKKNKSKPQNPEGGGDGKSKRSKRSFMGVVVAVAAAVGLWGWAVTQHVAKKSRDRKLLDAMLRRPVKYTEHAACRMDCRFVTEDDVQQTLQTGYINDRKSDPALRPCPKYVVNAAVRQGSKHVETVLAACPTETRVVTVIDTATDWPCGPC